MQLRLLTGTLIIAALPLAAQASGEECFPACAEPAQIEVKVEMKVDATLETVAVVSPRGVAGDTPAPGSCGASFMMQAESLNDKFKPVREIVGYVRSPPGLAIKLVNDHIVKIPAWVGYAMDPVGSIKNRAIVEARTRVRAAMNAGARCATDPANEAADAAEGIDAKLSV